MKLPFFNDGECYEHSIDEGIDYVKFTDEDFEELFDQSSEDVKEWFSRNSVNVINFDFSNGFIGSEGDNLAIFYDGVQSGVFEVFTFAKTNGNLPDRWQDREDYTEWLQENFEA